MSPGSHKRRRSAAEAVSQRSAIDTARIDIGAVPQPLAPIRGLPGFSDTLPVTRERCAERLVDALEQAGVDTVYGVPGGAISPIYDVLTERPHIRVVHARHESTALFMTIGHVRMRPDSLPCVLLTSGPGVTNAVTGMAAAKGEQVPVVVLGGEVPKTKFGRNALQEGSSEALDTLGIVRSVARSVESLSIPGRAAFQLTAALHRARRERGPVFLSIPLDVAATPTPSVTFAQASEPHSDPDASAIATAARAIRGARSPLLLLGSGARHAWATVRAMAEELNIATMTSPKAKGIVPETAPYCLGVFGHGGHPSALDWLRSHPPDVVLAVGCGLGETSTNSWSPMLQASATMIQIDVDVGQLGRNYRVDLAIEGDCLEVLERLRAELADCQPWEHPLSGITFLQSAERLVDSTPLAPARVLTVLQETMPEDTVYTCDIGEHLLFALHHLCLTRPDQLIVAQTLASMGSGIGAAIGAKLAAPERKVVAICGDYGFQMYGMDLNTCVEQGLDVIFVVMNDSRMRMVEAGLARIYGRGLPMDGPRINFAEVARAHGAWGFEVDDVAELRQALRHVDTRGPTVIDVRIDSCAVFPVNARVAEINSNVAMDGSAGR